MRKILMALTATTALAAASAATASVSVSIWTDQAAAASDATIAQAGSLGAPNATTTVSSLNFSTGDSTSTTVDQWLGTSIGGATGGHALNNTYLLFTGTTTLAAGSNTFNVEHDDGVELSFPGLGGIVLSAPGPTGAVSSPFNVTAPSAGTYSFTLAYGECCGGPAVLDYTINSVTVGGVPEPATWGLMLLGVGMVGAGLRMNRKSALATA